MKTGGCLMARNRAVKPPLCVELNR